MMNFRQITTRTIRVFLSLTAALAALSCLLWCTYESPIVTGDVYVFAVASRVANDF